MSREGDIFRNHIEPGRYIVVQHLEVDVCPVRDRWLSALVAEVDAILETSSVMSGPRVDVGLVCSPNAAGDECTTAAELPDYIRRHVNGNAMYRMGDSLQDLLKSTMALYPDWPFDLAAYLAANATNQLHLLRYSKFVQNRVVPVYFKYAYDPALYHPSTHLVHCPLAYKKRLMMDAVDATLSSRLPAVVIGAFRVMHPDIFRNLHVSLQRQGIENVVWTSGMDEPDVLEAIMRMHPFAFAESMDLRQSPTSDQRAPPLDIIEHLTNRGHSVFYLDADSVVLGKFTNHLVVLDTNAVHFASGAVQSHGHFFPNETAPRYHFTSKAFYVPANVEWRALADAWRKGMGSSHLDSPDGVINAAANCTNISSCEWNGVPIRLLKPEDFMSGTNLLKLWPNKHAVKATVYIDVTGGLHPSTNATREIFRRQARFRMQQIGQWLLPQDQTCCPNILVADDVNVSDDVYTVHAYINLLLHMHETALRGGIACAVPPFIYDIRTNEKAPFDILFDPTYLFPNVRLFPSLTDVPVCQGGEYSMYNASLDHTSAGTQHWPLHAFSGELQRALEHFSRSPLVADSFCLDDTTRSSAEAALHLLRKSAATMFAPFIGNARRVYLAGSWRLLDNHVRQQLPNVFTLLSPSLYPPSSPTSSFYSSFGLRSHYPRLGEDPVMNLLDSLVCRLARNITATDSTTMKLSEVYAGIFEYIEPDVLDEELAITKIYDTSPSPPFLIPLDTLENNGFSNLINDAQVLSFLANKVGLRATMVPLSMTHLVNFQRPWSDVVDNVTRFFAEMKSLRPSIWAVLRHPSLLIEVLDGYMLPVGSSNKWSHNASSLRPDDQWHKVALKLHSDVAFHVKRVAFNEAEWEKMLLQGYDVVLSAKPAYLGLADTQIVPTFNSSHASGRDIVFRPFRAFNFQNHNLEHAAFAKSWRDVFQIPPSIQNSVERIVQSLAPNFTCYHARVADEFYAQQKQDRPQFQKENVFNMLTGYIKSQEVSQQNTSAPSIYLTSDINARVEDIAGRPTYAATSCHVFGCPQIRDDVTWGLIEREVCTAAHTFIGNIYSTFTLSICARRNDQSCRDMFNQSLCDGRFLF
jgi:hypothetical protein